MEHELVGLHASATRWRPVAAGRLAFPVVALALLPIRPVWLWAGLLGAGAAAPWIAGAVAALRRRRPRPYWRLSAAGLERVAPDGTILTRYERSRIEGLAITVDDGGLTVLHRFGRTTVGGLDAMGLEPLAVFVTARRLGIPVFLLDGAVSGLSEDGAAGAGGDLGLPRHHVAEQRLLDQEAALLAAAHEPPREDPPASGAAGGPVRLASPEPVPGRGRTAVLGALLALLGATMIAHIAVEGTADFGRRLAAGCWAVAAVAGVAGAWRRLLRTARVEWTIRRDGLLVRTRPGAREGLRLAAADVAALVVGPGLALDPLTDEPRRVPLAVLAFDHRMRLLARLPARGLDGFQLAHGLDEHGYRVVTPGPRTPRSPAYGLEGLPEVFAQVPGGRLVVADGGLGWVDAAGDVVLRMPEDRIGGIELLTIAGHAWVRLYDSDGDEFFAAPLSALRISRTDLRESARRAGLPVTDAEYDAYLSAAFHSAVSTLSSVPSEEAAVPSHAAGGSGGEAPVETSGGAGAGPAEAAPDAPPAPSTAPGVLLDATRRSRVASYAMSVLLCEFVALLGAVWLGPDLGGLPGMAAWAVPAGVPAGLLGYWLYDRNRAQLRVSAAGVAVVTLRGRVEWEVRRELIGGVGVDESTERMPRLVVWGPTGRVLRQVTFPPDLGRLRRACERYGLPWGPPDADRPAPPPPEL
ncbi:hypothetical protein Acsp04_64640 [Actinomadura sp. NBRC 104425]|uniref:hypothetical protein n=1 Tax=Actinomadura sp. NBRC 104425 TaxID=3032204 RepID=UPI0024A0D968|nr:hypothetical protein [Actinomadura sp. NBRC 104425]GLZ16229.1 hypothetical protein Acsp04_64640 [Actinomadura sp. NBRC 104425]